MPSGTPPIRPASAADLTRAAATLAEAFDGSEWTDWVVDEDDRRGRLQGLYTIFLGVALEYGEVWVADDVSAVAAWTTTRAAAEQESLMQRAGLAEEIARLSGTRVGNLLTGAELMAPHAPQEEHWTLSVVGVAPARQGAGLGTAVLAPTLERLDAHGEVAALDTSSPRNVRLYERLGFRTTAELDMPHGGPHVWLMRRDPLR